MTATLAAPSDSTVAVLDDPLEHSRFTRWVVGPQGEKLGESSLQLAGMYCAACSGIIEQALQGVSGVRSARVSAAAERATVCWDPARTQPSALIAAVRAAGYDAVPDAAAEARVLRKQEGRQALWRLFVASFCAMQVMMMATPSYVAGPGEMAPDLRQLLNWGSWILSLPVLAFSSGPFFKGAWRSLRHRRMGMDVPVSLGIAITFIASTGATFDPGGLFGDEVYFDSLTMFVSFLLASRYVELRARQQAAETLETALARLPETAWRLDGSGRTEPVSVHRLRPGDRVRVPAGQAFPADGTLDGGSTQADEALLSGESAPVPKQAGSELIAGSINLGAPVEMTVLRVGGDTRFEAIVSMMRSAMTQRPASARVADRWAAPFLWVVLVLAAAAALVWSFIDPSRAVWVAVAVLIVTCPCALSLAAPATLVAATRGLARRGVLLQRIDALEQLATATQAFIDKTGTLTEDRPQLQHTRLTPAGQAHFAHADAATTVAAGLAAWSSHPLSRALVATVEGGGPLLGARAVVGGVGVGGAGDGAQSVAWQQVAELPGQGLQAHDADGRVWRLGSSAWAWGPTDEAWSGDAPVSGATGDPAGPAPAVLPPDLGEDRVWLGCDGHALAAFAFDEALRPGAAQAVQALLDDGVQVSLLSGDSPARAQALALRVGIRDVRAGATPQSKLDAVAAAQRSGERVLMVGDGVNDAPVLARADVSLAMGQGALVSRSHADAVITSNHLADLVAARRTAQRAMRIVRQNFVWAGGYNALCIPLAMVGWLPPWAAGLGMALSSLVVVGNALRASQPS